MPRTKGATNAGFHERRRDLAERLRARLADTSGPPASFRDLAAGVGVSVSTLRHYFGDRTGLVADVMALHAPGAARHLDFLRTPGPTFEDSIRSAAAYLALGLSQPVVAQLHQVGLAEGLGRPNLGEVYLTEILEPMVQALETRLLAHMDAGEMRRVDPRGAALGFIAPLILAHLHQAALGGDRTRPLDSEALLSQHCEAFVRAYVV